MEKTWSAQIVSDLIDEELRLNRELDRASVMAPVLFTLARTSPFVKVNPCWS